MKTDIQKLESRIGYSFNDPGLLNTAMHHSSYINEHRQSGEKDNERLEFLGDAVLELVTSDFLFSEYPDLPEGDMTRLRASLVCEPTLAISARAFGLPAFLMLGKGEERTGGRDRASIVSDALEALIGAIYLDGGLEKARAFVLQFILNDIEHKKLFHDSKTILQEIIQRDFRDEEMEYELTGESGPDHAKRFEVQVRLGERRFRPGSGPTKKAAEQEAAYHAILALRE